MLRIYLMGLIQEIKGSFGYLQPSALWREVTEWLW